MGAVRLTPNPPNPPTPKPRSVAPKSQTPKHPNPQTPVGVLLQQFVDDLVGRYLDPQQHPGRWLAPSVPEEEVAPGGPPPAGAAAAAAAAAGDTDDAPGVMISPLQVGSAGPWVGDSSVDWRIVRPNVHRANHEVEAPAPALSAAVAHRPPRCPAPCPTA